MRYGVLSDIHGNLPALAAVREALPPVDRYLCAGDVVGYNPWPAECVEQVREMRAVTVQGNHDRAVATDSTSRLNAMAAAGVSYARAELSAEQIEWLDALLTHQTVGGGDVLIVHGHPDDPDRYTYPESFSASMLGEDYRVVITGHTHVQGYREFEHGIVMNPGSVGQPRDGNPEAAAAILELTDETVRLEEYRVPYDIGRVTEAVEAAGLPEKIGTRLASGT